MLKWFELFPEFKRNHVYLAGESYAGIYVPLLLEQIHKHNDKYMKNPKVFRPKLKGMLVVNGVTNWAYDTFPAMFETARRHYIISEPFYQEFKDAECEFEHPIGAEFYKQPNVAQCVKLLIRFMVQLKPINMFNMYAPCLQKDKKPDAVMENLMGFSRVGGKEMAYQQYVTAAEMAPWLDLSYQALQEGLEEGFEFLSPEEHEALTSLYYKGQGSVPACEYVRGIITYLNRAGVKKALGIPKDWKENKEPWLLCQRNYAKYYVRADKGAQGVWKNLKGQYSMLAMSGDVDLAVPTWGTMAWMKALGQKLGEDWKPLLPVNST